MKVVKNSFFLLLLWLTISCSQDSSTPATPNPTPTAYRTTRTVTYNGIPVTVVIDKPAQNVVDVMVVYHGTVSSDANIVSAANTTLDKFKSILNRPNMMLVSVAYPQENILFGDGIAQAEAALLWVKNNAATSLGITLNKIFMGGHSQGGYMVTRLNMMHQTNGVIANAPGPLNLVYRCGLEENGQILPSAVCSNLAATYGSTLMNPTAYFERSLLHFTANFKSDILFVQGLNDSPIQLFSWPMFKEAVSACTTFQSVEFVEVPGGHTALFDNLAAQTACTTFINER